MKIKDKSLFSLLDKDFLFILLLIVVSGSPVLNNEEPIKFSVPGLLVVSTWFYRRKIFHPYFLKTYFVFFAVFSFCFVAQYIEFNVFSLSMLGLFLRLAAGAVVVFSVGKYFVRHYFNAMAFLAAVSLPLYISQFFIDFSSIPDIIPTFAPTDSLKSVFIHTYITTAQNRNAGLFWEPGAFQGFLNLALMLVPFDRQTIMQARGRIGVIVLAIATTLSTTGYIVFFIVIFLKVLLSKGSVFLKVCLIFIIPAVATASYFSFDHLGGKVAEEIDWAQEADVDFNPSRLGSFIFDLYYIEKRPFTGNGFVEATRYSDHGYLHGQNLGHGNGFSGFIASMGILSLLGYIILLRRSALFSNSAGFFCFLIFFITLLQGEHFLLLPIFLALPFVYGKQLPLRAQ